MSSLRVRAKNKLLTALGAAKPSTNVAFDLAYSDFENMLARLTALDSAVRGYAGALKNFHGSASSMIGAIDRMAFGGGGSASLQGPSPGTTEMQQLAGEARVACADGDMLVLQEATTRLEEEVLLPMKGWIKHAQGLQQQTAAFQEQKALYDHYTRKVATLRETHDKKTSNRQHEKPKDTERMFRNEQKLASTTQEYTRVSDAIVRDLRAFVLSRDAALAPLLRRILRGRVIYAARMNEASARIRTLLDDGVEEAEGGGVLGQFTALAQGGPAVNASVIAAATTVASTTGVTKSSFDDFVGTSAPGGVDAFATTPVPRTQEMQTTSLANGSYGLSAPHYQHYADLNKAQDNDWNSFASTPMPPTQEMQMPSPTNGDFGLSEPHYAQPTESNKQADNGWNSFASTPMPPTHEMHKPSPMGANYTPPLSVPQFMTVSSPTNAGANSWGNEFPGTAPVFSTMPAQAAPPSAQVSAWDAFPPASAPSDPFPTAEWGAPITSEAPWQQSQQQVPVHEFRDMHVNALGGPLNSFREKN